MNHIKPMPLLATLQQTLKTVFAGPVLRPHGNPLELAPGTARTVRIRPGQSLMVVAGRVWLTKDHELDDHFLDAGAQCHSCHGEAVVIECMGAQPVRYRVARTSAQIK